MSEVNDEVIEIEEAPEITDAPEIVVEEQKTDVPSVDETLETLKSQLDQERRAREASDQRAFTAAQQAQQASAQAHDANFNLVTNAIGQLEQTQGVLRNNLEAAFADQDFSLAADIQAAMANNAANLTKLREGKEALEAAPKVAAVQHSDPVEALASQLSPRSGNWVRQHPEFARDQQLFQKMLAADQFVRAEGVAADTDDYFARVEKMLGVGSSDAPRQEQQTRAAPPAAPVSRGGNGTGSVNPNRVTLTADEREMASAMGMTDLEYAKNKLALSKEGRLGRPH